MEERVLKGDRAYESSMPRLEGDEERFVLLAKHQTLVERRIPQPGRAKDNSPTIYRWVSRGKGDKSRPGRKNSLGFAGRSLSPLAGLGRM